MRGSHRHFTAFDLLFNLLTSAFFRSNESLNPQHPNPSADASTGCLSHDKPADVDRSDLDNAKKDLREMAPYKDAIPHADGLYHCPWEGAPECKHKPHQLKYRFLYANMVPASRIYDH